MLPKIAVLLPTYNCASFINECIDSVLSQSFQDFVVYIVDDCSTDDTVARIKAYKDERIRLHVKPKNTGYTDSLQWAIKQVETPYLARMDADDICHPLRFEKQLKFLENNPDISLVGTFADVIGQEMQYQYPTAHKEMVCRLLFGVPLVHPSVMGKTTLFKAFPYNKAAEPAEDYDLWTRLALAGQQMANIPETLLMYRWHPNQVSQARIEKQNRSAQQSMFLMFQKLTAPNTSYSKAFIINAIWPKDSCTKVDFIATLRWYDTLIDPEHFFDTQLLEKALWRKRYNVCKFYALHPEKRIGSWSPSFRFLYHYPKLGSIFYIKHWWNRLTKK